MVVILLFMLPYYLLLYPLRVAFCVLHASCFVIKFRLFLINTQTLSEFDLAMPHSQIPDKPIVCRGREPHNTYRLVVTFHEFCLKALNSSERFFTVIVVMVIERSVGCPLSLFSAFIEISACPL